MPKETQETKLQPKIVPNVKHPDLHPVEYVEPELEPGMVLLVALKNGQETGRPFKVSQRTYERSYNNPDKFTKKKPVK